MAQKAQRPRAGGACSLQAWSNADLADRIVDYLPLAIAELPMVCRRWRDDQPALEFRLARRHKTLPASRHAFLDEIRATGRDMRLHVLNASDIDIWVEYKPRANSACRAATVGGISCIEITKMAS